MVIKDYVVLYYGYRGLRCLTMTVEGYVLLDHDCRRLCLARPWPVRLFQLDHVTTDDCQSETVVLRCVLIIHKQVY